MMPLIGSCLVGYFKNTHIQFPMFTVLIWRLLILARSPWNPWDLLPPPPKKNPPAPWLFPKRNVFPSRQRTVPAFLRSLSRELKKNQWKNELMKAYRAELEEWGAWKVLFQSYFPSGSLTSIFIWAIFFLLIRATDFVGKEGLLEV